MVAHHYRDARLYVLRWLRTITSELGMAFSRLTDQLTILIEGANHE